MTRNLLGNETSPYLLQHKDNPVHWRPWGQAAFDAAAESDRPILLSIGYAACHWCHVMAHESFEDPAIAGLMNELFVCVKVDREERPDVDAIYMNALGLLGQPGGWPLTMFLNARAQPFWGGTYFPPEPRYGRPGFPQILQRVAEVYRDDPETVAKNTGALTEALGRMARADADVPDLTLSLPVLDQAARRMAGAVDPVSGGIGGAPKFPQPYALEFMWRAWLRGGDASCRDAVLRTLTHMCQGGIYDHLGGGFARYSTDDRWLVPHFEKMLYDNAQLLGMLTLAWQATGSRLFAERAAETVGWLQREMIAPDGGFAATLDADSEGVEGKFYVWSEAEVDRVLGPDATLFKRVYDVSAHGNWEETNILNRTAHLDILDDESEATLAVCRARLLQARDGRIRPGWDDKLLADWNGLMIASLAESGLAFGRPDWIAAAREAYAAVRRHLEGEGGQLLHSYRAGKAQHRGMLDDYANMARAALALHEIAGDATALAAARAWVAVLDARFWDGENGGYFFADAEASDLIARQRHCHDNAVPAGNGTMATVLTRLWYLTGETAYRDRADALFAAFTADLARNFMPMTGFMSGFELMQRAVQVVLVGDDGSLLAAAGRVAQPNRVLQQVAPGQALPPGHPAAGKGQVDGRPTAYVCVGTTCSLPLTDADAFIAMLAHPEGI